MKYAEQIEVNLPRERVFALFDNPENLKKWMDGLQSFEHLSGTPGQIGAKSKLTFEQGKRNMEMIETLTVRKPPEELSGVYEINGMNNIVRNYFQELGPDKTLVINDQEFQFTGFMKFIAPLMSGMFKKQSRVYLKAFKKFAESQG